MVQRTSEGWQVERGAAQWAMTMLEFLQESWDLEFVASAAAQI